MLPEVRNIACKLRDRIFMVAQLSVKDAIDSRRKLFAALFDTYIVRESLHLVECFGSGQLRIIDV